MIIICCLPHDFDIRSYIGAYSPSFDEISLHSITMMDARYWLFTLWIWHHILYWGIFPHFEVTRFLSDSVRDSSETCFWFWDYHIPHHFGYSFEIRFRVSPLRHWLILHSDFLADYCWAEDSWLMMLDSSFGCVLDTHTRAYSPIPLRFLSVIGRHDYLYSWL